MVELENCFDAAQRERIVKARLAFDLDPDAFRARHASAQRELGDRIHAARARLAALDFDDTVHARVSALCIDAAVDGLRADLVMLRAARALAALEQADAVTVSHVERVADAVLRHRRHAPTAVVRRAATQRRTRRSLCARCARSPDDSPGAAQSNATASQGDWGYLPPEPAGLRDVKGVVPLPLKTLSHRAGAPRTPFAVLDAIRRSRARAGHGAPARHRGVAGDARREARRPAAAPPSALPPTRRHAGRTALLRARLLGVDAVARAARTGEGADRRVFRRPRATVSKPR